MSGATSHGKGDRSRVSNRELYRQNYERIFKKKEKPMRKKKSALQKRKDNPNSKYWGTKALKVWREICLIKFNNQCAICSSTAKLEAHHIISKKTCKALTYSTDNQLLLCTYHHNFFGTEEHRFSAHKNPLKFYNYIREHYNDIYNDILAIDIQQQKKIEMTTKEHFLQLEKIKKDYWKVLIK